MRERAMRCAWGGRPPVVTRPLEIHHSWVTPDCEWLNRTPGAPSEVTAAGVAVGADAFASDIHRVEPLGVLGVKRVAQDGCRVTDDRMYSARGPGA